jgi:hypothetical protein
LGFLGRIANHRKLPPRIALAGNLQYWTQQKNPWSFNDVQISQGRLGTALRRRFAAPASAAFDASCFLFSAI